MPSAATANIDAVLWQAHRAALATRLIGLDRSGTGLRIPAGNGVFVAELLKGHDLDTGDDQMFHVQARTWLHRDQLPDKQIPTAISEIVGERLGDNLLLPLPLRHTYAVSAEVMAMVRRSS